MSSPATLITAGRAPQDAPFEIVERKGTGHPDTLADSLAEHLSCAYSKYTLSQFGAILRHQFDKTALMCGRARVSFGGGELVEPIRVLLNGRASARLGDTKIPVEEILTQAAREFFQDRFPMLDAKRDFRLIFEVRQGANSTTGGILGDEAANASAIHYRFHPRTLRDLPETRLVEANDTSLGCAWTPYSALEFAVLSVERDLNSVDTKRAYPWLGSDIKIMASRVGNQVSMVVAAPILASLTASPAEYFDRLRAVDERIRNIVSVVSPGLELCELVMNSGDDLEGRKLYMNFTGSSIESGDEGVVGRGNRMGGLISPARPYTMEGIAGKNPRYHVGKVYCAAAHDVAHALHEEYRTNVNVYLVNRMGEALSKPWLAVVEHTSELNFTARQAQNVIDRILLDLGRVTDGILAGRYPLF